MKKINIAYLVLLILITFFLRLYMIDLTILEGDMFRDYSISEYILDGNIRYTGIGSLELQQSFGPVMFYLTAFSFLAYDHVLSPVIMVAILNSLAVILCFLFCNKYFNEKTAYIASFLYAVNPWHVYLSHFYWNPNFLPFFSILFFYFLFGYIVEKKDHFLIIASFILALMLHFHLTPLFLIPVLIFAILIYRRDTKIKYFLYSILSFVIPLIPYLYFNVKNKMSLLGPIVYGTIRESNDLITSFLEGYGMPIMLGTNYLGKYVYGTSNIFGSLFIKYLLYFISGLLVIVFISSVIYILLRVNSSDKFKKNSKYVLLLLIFVIPSTLQVIRLKGISPHYYFVIYPVQFIVMGLLLVFLYNKFVNYKKVLFTAFILLLILLIFNSYLLFNYVEKNGATSYPGEFSIPYKAKIEVLDYIAKDSNYSNATIIFYKYDKSFSYLIDKEYPSINYIYVANLDELEDVHGYLILDRVSYHRISYLNNRESEFFNSLQNKKVIKSVEVIKF